MIWMLMKASVRRFAPTMNFIDTTYSAFLSERTLEGWINPWRNFPTTHSETYPELLPAAGRQMAAIGKSYLI